MCKANDIEKFESLLMSIRREGMDKLLEFIRKSDFYIAPGSTKFHSSYKGGLLKHSLNVAECLLNKLQNPIWSDILSKVGRDSLLLVALLHDVCKTYYYTEQFKNQKTYDKKKIIEAKNQNPSCVKRDNKGEFVWEVVPVYVVEDKYPLGHGSKSVIFLMQYIKLNMSEIMAINHHMGAFCDSSQWNTLGKAYEIYPLSLALHEADLEATHLMEVEVNGN